MIAIWKTKIVVDNDINETGELVLRENSLKSNYLLGIKLFEKEYNRQTSQTELKLKDINKMNSIGFTSIAPPATK